MHYVRPSEEARERPMTPVWAPDPGVPLTARILAYTFAAVLVLTVALSIFNKRPPDAAPYPDKWMLYTSKHGWSIAYPEGWHTKVETQIFKDGEAIALWPEGLIRVEFLTIDDLPSDIGEDDQQKINEVIEKNMRETFSGYTERAEHADSTSAKLWTLFTFQGEKKGKRTMAGAWQIRTGGNKAVVMVALSPLASWTTVERLLNPMDAHFAFDTTGK